MVERMSGSVIFTIIFSLVLALGIVGAFWGRSRKKKLILEEEFKELKKDLAPFPKEVLRANYSELEELSCFVKRQSVHQLEERLKEFKEKAKKDKKRNQDLEIKRQELAGLIEELKAMGERTEDLERTFNSLSGGSG